MYVFFKQQKAVIVWANIYCMSHLLKKFLINHMSHLILTPLQGKVSFPS